MPGLAGVVHTQIGPAAVLELMQAKLAECPTPANVI